MTRIALVAGEPSGDLLAARVVQGLQRQTPQASVMGIGGPALKQAGQEQWYDLDALSVFGYVDALKRLPTLWRIFQGTKRRSEEHTSELQSRGHLVCRLLLVKK